MKNYAIFVEDRDGEDAVNRVLTTLGIDPENADRAMDDPLDVFTNKDELKKELPQMQIDPNARAAALSAIDDGKMPLRDFVAILKGKDQGEEPSNNDPLQVTGSPVGFMPGGGTADSPTPVQ
tara:strand:- start:6497 stop:6862 length:366 start_codon:yes stop_codon:yes gene_type:complete